MSSNISDINLRFVDPYDVNTGTIRKGNNRKKKNKNSDEDEVYDSEMYSGTNGMHGGTSSPNNNTEQKKMPKIPEPNINLSRDELLKLLSVFEGELQARDEVIAILKTERANNPDIKSRYGLCDLPLNALQRDSCTLEVTSKDQVGEQTQEQLRKIIQHQKESHRKLKQMFLNGEQTNQRLMAELDEAKRTHQDYILKSEDFVSLLERERERLKQTLDQEKATRENKEVEFTRRMKDMKDELSRLKSLSLMLVEERQTQMESITNLKKNAKENEAKLKESSVKLKQLEEEAATEKEHSTQLEYDLEDQTNKFFQEKEELDTKFKEEEEKSNKLQAKINILTTQLKKLKCVEKNLRKTDDQLWRIHAKLEQDEEHENLLEEVELLRDTVKDMQEAEKIYTQAQEEYAEIKMKLEEELAVTKQLRADVKSMQISTKTHKELERSIEDTDFKFVDLQMKLEYEKKRGSDTREQLQKMSNRMQDMDEFERKLGESEDKLKQMREIANNFNDEKQTAKIQMKHLTEKNNELKQEIEDEKKKVSETTEKLIAESKKCLKLKENFAAERRTFTKEINGLKEKIRLLESEKSDVAAQKQTQAEAANDRLRRQVIMLKSRLDQLEAENEKMEEQIKNSKNNSNLSKVNNTPQLLSSSKKEIQEIEKKYKELEIQFNNEKRINEELRNKLNHETNKNNNSNSVRLKGVAVVDVETQTIKQPKPGLVGSLAHKYEYSTLPRTPRSRDNAIAKAAASLRRVQSTRSPSVTRPITPHNNSTFFSTIDVKPVTERSRIRSSESMDGIKSNSNVSEKAKFPTPLKTNDSVMTSSVKNSSIEMKMTQDSSKKGGATIKIARDKNTGQPYIHTAGADDNIRIKLNENTKAKTSEIHATDVKKNEIKVNESKNEVKVVNASKSKIQLKRSSTPEKISRRQSRSPTLIPKFRSPPPTKTPADVHRIRRSGIVAATRSKLER